MAKRKKISLLAIRKRKTLSIPKAITLTAVTSNDLDARLYQISREWGSFSNFASAITWAWTQGYIKNDVAMQIQKDWKEFLRGEIDVEMLSQEETFDAVAMRATSSSNKKHIERLAEKDISLEDLSGLDFEGILDKDDPAQVHEVDGSEREKCETDKSESESDLESLQTTEIEGVL